MMIKIEYNESVHIGRAWLIVGWCARQC